MKDSRWAKGWLHRSAMLSRMSAGADRGVAQDHTLPKEFYPQLGWKR